MKTALIVTGALALTGCARGNDTFGVSYDECVLKNATRVADGAARYAAKRACQRNFERASTKEERNEQALTATAELANRPILESDRTYDQVLRITVRNNSTNLIVTGFDVKAEFRHAGGQQSQTLSDSEVDVIEPLETARLALPLRSGEAAAESVVVTLTPTKVVPLGRN